MCTYVHTHTHMCTYICVWSVHVCVPICIWWIHVCTYMYMVSAYIHTHIWLIHICVMHIYPINSIPLKEPWIIQYPFLFKGQNLWQRFWPFSWLLVFSPFSLPQIPTNTWRGGSSSLAMTLKTRLKKAALEATAWVLQVSWIVLTYTPSLGFPKSSPERKLQVVYLGVISGNPSGGMGSDTGKEREPVAVCRQANGTVGTWSLIPGEFLETV